MLRSGIPLPEGGAAIVNIASIAAKGCPPKFTAYVASKTAIIALTKSAATELAPHGIRCNVVLPGWTDTPMSAGEDQNREKEVLSKTPLKRAAKPREIAEAIVFLCCSAASSYVTGAVLEVTGGLHM
ncbi:hypothetical protein V5799_010976 [Amblyomma americanum]|uniref:Uncharacterized protein n=1 Tax=Amblyomma americanum TaxID=6943 RepID=A0AAQ4EIH5_AMBAM